MIKKISIFYLLAFVFTIVIAILQGMTRLDFELVILPQLGPAFAAFVYLFFFKNVAIRLNFGFDTHLIPKKLIAFATPILIIGTAFLIGKAVGIEVSITDDHKYPVFMLAGGMLIGAIGEEIGWRGFLQPLLENGYSRAKATTILGVLWGLWHIGQYKNGPLFMLGFLIFTVSASFVLRKILENTQFNVWIAASFHLATNVGFYFFFKNNLTDAYFMLINGAVWAIIALFSQKITLYKAQH